MNRYEELEGYNERVEIKAEFVDKKLRDQTFLKVGNDMHHIEDFVSGVYLPLSPFVSMLAGNSESFQQEMAEKYYLWCTKIAIQIIELELKNED